MAHQRAAFPAGGRNWEDLQAEMRTSADGDLDWQGGRTPLFVFLNDQKTKDIGKAAFNEFFHENALGRKRAFFSIDKMERDILDYGLSLFNAPAGAEGAFSSGGSESIFMAMKAARDTHRARHGRKPGTALNIVMPRTAHPAFDKAADAMDLEIRRGELRDDYRADVATLRPLMDENTMALVGSAPCFPHGVIDPIAELSALAEETGIWLHVDACVGGWIAPFFTRIGRDTPDFDFRFPGVRSISADLHKFGFCPKPASTVFYRQAEDLDRALFRADKWPNGAFATATLAGTRPGGAVAGAWAVLNYLGTAGYEDAARRLAEMTDRYVTGINAIDGLHTWAKPDISIINYGSDELDIFAVAERMHALGWLPGLTNRPKGMHAMMSMFHDPARDQFLQDLEKCTVEVRAAGKVNSELEAEY